MKKRKSFKQEQEELFYHFDNIYPLDRERGVEDCKWAIKTSKYHLKMVKKINPSTITPNPLREVISVYYLFVRTMLLCQRLLKQNNDAELRKFLESEHLQVFYNIKKAIKEKFSGKYFIFDYEPIFVLDDYIAPSSRLKDFCTRFGVPVNANIDGTFHTLVFGRTYGKEYMFGSSCGFQHVGGSLLRGEAYYHQFIHNENLLDEASEIRICSLSEPILDYDTDCMSVALHNRNMRIQDEKQKQINICLEIEKNKKSFIELRESMLSYFSKTDFNGISADDKKKILSYTIDNDMLLEIEYKGDSRVIEPLSIGGDKVEAYHIRGYSKSNSHYSRSFFIDKIDSLRIISREEELNNLLEETLSVSSGPVLDGGKFLTIISNDNGDNVYVVCPADYNRTYVLFKYDDFSIDSLTDGYYSIEPYYTCAIKNPNGEDDFENDGGSSKYRFRNLSDIADAIHLKEINNRRKNKLSIK